MRRLHPGSTFLVLSTALALVAGAPAALSAQDGATGETLYHRLGGYDVIAATVDDFFARFGEDPALAPFLGGINAAEGARVRQRFIDFMCARTGGPCLYLGRDMAAAHEGLGITNDHFDRVVTHFRAALQANQVPEGAAAELMAMVEGLRSQIVSP